MANIYFKSHVITFSLWMKCYWIYRRADSLRKRQDIENINQDFLCIWRTKKLIVCLIYPYIPNKNKTKENITANTVRAAHSLLMSSGHKTECWRMKSWGLNWDIFYFNFWDHVIKVQLYQMLTMKFCVFKPDNLAYFRRTRGDKRYEIQGCRFQQDQCQQGHLTKISEYTNFV